MKKIFMVLAVLGLSSCFYLKGDYTLGRRNAFNDFFYTYNIRYYDDEGFKGEDVEFISESDFKEGVARHTVPGGIVVSSKMYEMAVYSNDYVRPSKKGGLVSYTVPVEFSDEKRYKLIGEVEIEGSVYRLVEPNRFGDVILINNYGDIYKRVGRIYNNRLALLNTAFIIEPEDVIFKYETSTSTGSKEIVQGFEVRYLGLKGYNMVFEYNRISHIGGDVIEDKKKYEFPMYDENVSFEGIGLQILDINDAGLEYKVTKI